ncbi:Opi1-domain-containing protein [Clavulina sp. PMI_390]|nr:Opi1-domain-containing protein [Clavulina sp. PMI_390]
MASVTDDDVLDAARTLGAMRNASSDASSSIGTPSLSAGPSSTAPSVTSGDQIMSPTGEPPEFLSRVSNMPFVGTAMRVYEQGKNSSRVVKFGAEMMEGTVKTMTRPVIDRLPMSQLDSFANRQLDRFGGSGGRSSSISSTSRGDDLSPGQEASYSSDTMSRRSPDSGPASASRGRKHLWLDDDNDAARRRSTSRDSYGSSSPPPSETAYSASSGIHSRLESDSNWHAIVHAHDQQQREQQALDDQESPEPGQEVQVAGRSGWQTVLREAGGLSAAISPESMKRLKYCLQWLQYANHHIDQQILLLRSFITSITPTSATASTSTSMVPYESLSLLSQVKTELINTIRQVVDVVSTYAGGALPEQARASVRSFILMLPERWTMAARADMGDPALLQRDPNGAGGMSRSAAMAASGRVLTLATESLDMMRSVTSVFKDTLERAEAWVDRCVLLLFSITSHPIADLCADLYVYSLQQLGLQRQQQRALPPSTSPSSSRIDAGPSRHSQSDWAQSQGTPTLRASPSLSSSTSPYADANNPYLPHSHASDYAASATSPLSTRAASESGEETETEGDGYGGYTYGDDERMGSPDRDGYSPAATSPDGRSPRGKKGDGMELDG